MPTPQNGQIHWNNLSANCLSVFDHFVKLPFKMLNQHRRFFAAIRSRIFGDSNSHKTLHFRLFCTKKKKKIGSKRFQLNPTWWFFKDSVIISRFFARVEIVFLGFPYSQATCLLEKYLSRSMSLLHLLLQFRLSTSAFCLTDMTLRTPSVPFLRNKIWYESKISQLESPHIQTVFWGKSSCGKKKSAERKKI